MIHERVLWGLFVSLGLGLAGCSQNPTNEPTPGEWPATRYVEPGQFTYQMEEGMPLSATGTGCGETREKALDHAEAAALYNLRSLTGQKRYRVRYHFLRDIPDPRRVCLEMEAIMEKCQIPPCPVR
ncbi:MAG: hypothetical protein OEV94_05725 [Deltaproteobacteria bacterium]|nr:hypothetical protein [Deltaproteobacteria bacterium]